MNKRKVLELLKPKVKMLGFSRRELINVADAIMSELTEDIMFYEESNINQKIDEYLSRKYNNANRQKDDKLSHVDWEQRRYEIAKNVLPSLIRIHCVIPNGKKQAVYESIELADALIER